MNQKKDYCNLLTYYHKKNYTALHDEIMKTLSMFNKISYSNLPAPTVENIDSFLEIFFYLILQDDFSLVNYEKNYFSYLPLIENLAYLSSYKTTDKILKILLDKDNPEDGKILLMMNGKCRLDVSLVNHLTAKNAGLVSSWLCSCFARHCFFNETVVDNLTMLLEKLKDFDLHPCRNMYTLFFNATYIDPENHLLIRKIVNTAIQALTSRIPIKNISCKKNRKKIAVVSGHWDKRHAVKTCIGSYFKTLSDDYALCLVRIVPAGGSAIPAYFSEVYEVKWNGHGVDCSSIDPNDFDLVIFTDIGMNIETLLMANMRIAPLQIAMYGHPVSSASDAIDYFFVGQLSETKEVEKHYTEKIIMLEGTGMNSLRPQVERPTFAHKAASLKKDTVHLFLLASPPKINRVLVQCWKKILDTAQRPLRMHLLPGVADLQELSALRKELVACIGQQHITFHQKTDYTFYMNRIKRCELAVGSFHYGDYNRVVDCLWMGTPVVVLQGGCGYQNTGPAVLRLLGLEELIAYCPDEYVSKTCDVIENDGMRRELQKRILSLTLEGTLVGNDDFCADFKSKIAKLLTE